MMSLMAYALPTLDRYKSQFPGDLTMVLEARVNSPTLLAVGNDYPDVPAELFLQELDERVNVGRRGRRGSVIVLSSIK